jgi:hypothetical protein
VECWFTKAALQFLTGERPGERLIEGGVALTQRDDALVPFCQAEEVVAVAFLSCNAEQILSRSWLNIDVDSAALARPLDLSLTRQGDDLARDCEEIVDGDDAFDLGTAGAALLQAGHADQHHTSRSTIIEVAQLLETVCFQSVRLRQQRVSRTGGASRMQLDRRTKWLAHQGPGRFTTGWPRPARRCAACCSRRACTTLFARVH